MLYKRYKYFKWKNCKSRKKLILMPQTWNTEAYCGPYNPKQTHTILQLALRFWTIKSLNIKLTINSHTLQHFGIIMFVEFITVCCHLFALSHRQSSGPPGLLWHQISHTRYWHMMSERSEVKYMYIYFCYGWCGVVMNVKFSIVFHLSK